LPKNWREILEELKHKAYEEMQKHLHGYDIIELRDRGAVAEVDPDIPNFEGVEKEQVEYDRAKIGTEETKTEFIKQKSHAKYQRRWRIKQKTRKLT
jgi:glutathione synthase/RimK-type ligase-like ATP-grasp enzyme